MRSLSSTQRRQPTAIKLSTVAGRLAALISSLQFIDAPTAHRLFGREFSVNMLQHWPITQYWLAE